MNAANKTVVRGSLYAFLLVLTACAQHVPMVDEASTPPLPDADYLAAARSGSTVYRILPEESLVLVRVTRAGTMKRLGHDHAVASEDVRGFVELNSDPSASRADIAMPIRNLVVDKPEHRDRLGLSTKPSETDVAGTYTNMLKVLEPALAPWVTAYAQIVSGDSASPTLAVSITMHGTAYEYLVPVEIEIDPMRLVVEGRTVIRHGEFGLKPFAAAGGLLRVADELEVEFHIVGALLSSP